MSHRYRGLGEILPAQWARCITMSPTPENSLYWFAFTTNKRGMTLDIEKRHREEIFVRSVRSAVI